MPVALNITEDDTSDTEVNELVVDAGKVMDNFETSKFANACQQLINVLRGRISSCGLWSN